MSTETPIHRAIADRGVAVGAMLYEFRTPRIMRILAAAGVDFALFDLEHTGWDAAALHPIFEAGRGTGVYPITRVVRASYSRIAGALDAGSRGIMAPMVESAAEARLLVESAKYPPLGRRGFGQIMSDDLAGGPAAYAERSNREGLVIAQIESPAGIENAEAIAATPGVDVVWLGQFDLALALGVAGRPDDPRYTAAFDHLVEVCRRSGTILGQMVSSTAEGEALRARGFEMLAYCDIWVFEHALRDEMHTLRGA